MQIKPCYAFVDWWMTFVIVYYFYLHVYCDCCFHNYNLQLSYIAPQLTSDSHGHVRKPHVQQFIVVSYKRYNTSCVHYTCACADLVGL